ncbi:MAG: Rossmann-like and DUF2520 domain-containing protein [Gemmatimonadales bacterium]
MTPAPGTTLTLGVIGPGRAGTGLALAWARAGHTVRLHGRRPKPVPEPLHLTIGPANAPPPWLADVAVVVLAVPDDAIPPLAEGLAGPNAVQAAHVVLHLSGSRGHDAMRALAPTGAALGSLHPLQTLVEPGRAPEHLRGAWAAVEGMPRALEAAERLARDVGLRPFRLRPESKLLYHVGAVFASNYFVVVEALAQRLLQAAGLAEGEAWEVLAPLVAGTLDNLRRQGPLAALTGPVARGDVETVTRHLAALAGTEAELYRGLGEAALELARHRGMDAAAAERVARVLATGRPPGRRREE